MRDTAAHGHASSSIRRLGEAAAQLQIWPAGGCSCCMASSSRCSLGAPAAAGKHLTGAACWASSCGHHETVWIALVRLARSRGWRLALLAVVFSCMVVLLPVACLHMVQPPWSLGGVAMSKLQSLCCCSEWMHAAQIQRYTISHSGRPGGIIHGQGVLRCCLLMRLRPCAVV